MYHSRRYEDALEQYKKNVELFPDNATAHLGLGLTYVEIGKHEEAIVELEKAVALAESVPESVQYYKGSLGYAYAKSGRRDEAKSMIYQLGEQINQKYVSPYLIASIYSALNEKDLAFPWLEKSYESREGLIFLLKVDPIFDNIRSDPRFEVMLKKIGLLK